MRQMPFGRRGVGERLEVGVGLAEWSGEVEAELPRRRQAVGKRIAA